MNSTVVMNNMVTHPLAKTFESVYGASSWGQGSGPGSNPYYTIEFRAFFEKFLRMNEIRSVVDIGCGDWQFMQFVNLKGIRYHGFDVVESVVTQNNAAFATNNVKFSVMPTHLSALPKADLLFIKDVLQHLPNQMVLDYVTYISANYRRSLITNSFEKIYTPTNIEIEAGGFRCLDLTADPFNVTGTYLFEFWAQPWERIRTLIL